MGSNPTGAKFSLARGDSQVSFNKGRYPGDLVYRQYCLLPAPYSCLNIYHFYFTGATRFHYCNYDFKAILSCKINQAFLLTVFKEQDYCWQKNRPIHWFLYSTMKPRVDCSHPSLKWDTNSSQITPFGPNQFEGSAPL